MKDLTSNEQMKVNEIKQKPSRALVSNAISDLHSFILLVLLFCMFYAVEMFLNQILLREKQFKRISHKGKCKDGNLDV